MRAALSARAATIRWCGGLLRASQLARRKATDSSTRAAGAAASESGDGTGAQSNISSRVSRRRMAHVPDFHTFMASEREQRTADLIATARARRAEQGFASSLGTDACTDGFGRRHSYLRLSLTERCNLRCRYCMPAEGVSLQDKEYMLRGDEVVTIAEHFHKLGVDKIRLTGGEPLISKDLGNICSKIGALPGLKSLAITTNGIALSRKLPALVSKGVNLFNISLDTLCPEKFQYITRRPGFDKVMRALDDLCETYTRAQTHGGVPFDSSAPRAFRMPKLNVVVTRGVNEGEVGDFVELTRDRPVDVRFIEFMPFDANSWSEDKFVSFEDMLAMITQDTRFAGLKLAKLDDETSSTSKGYRMEGFAGQLGFITSMSRPFCSGCNRLRVTADGNLKVCLFGDETQSVSLRDVLRSAEQFGEQPQQLLSDVISLAISGKAARLGGHKDMLDIADRSRHNRPMIQIGG